MLAGGILAAAYVFKVLGHTFTQAEVPHEPGAVPARMEWAAMLLACAAILLGLLATPLLAMLAIGEPFGLPGGGP
jgi:NADH:ubiquinone oxidoreductase subunit 5 (subunit L)/multisubunit Na+/H+ antiporter MnhA subunit